ncbi:hypothetical protein QOT17_015331 [Balamuthia mandrillaris]
MLMIKALYQHSSSWSSCKWNSRAQIKVNRLKIFKSFRSNLGRSQGKDQFFTEGAKEVDKEVMLQGSWCRAKAEANTNKEAEKKVDLGFTSIVKIWSSSAQSIWKRVHHNGKLEVTEGGTTEDVRMGGQEKSGNFLFSRVNTIAAFSSSSAVQTWAFSCVA